MAHEPPDENGNKHSNENNEKLVELLVSTPSLFEGDDRNLPSEVKEQIQSIMVQMYTLCSVEPMQDEGDLLCKAIKARYKKIEEERFEGLPDEKYLEDRLTHIEDALTELQRINQNVEYLFERDFLSDPPFLLSSPLTQYSQDQAFVDNLKSIGITVKKAIDELYKMLFDRKTTAKGLSFLNFKERYEALDSTLADLRQNMTETQEISKNAQNVLEETKETLVHVKTQSESILANVLTIMGIFVAILMAFFGGFSIVRNGLEVSFSEIRQVRFAYFLLMGQVLANLFFVLMFMITRLSEHSISVYGCGKKKDSDEVTSDCASCVEDCSFNTKLKKKYPYVIYTNEMVLCGYFILWAWWYVDVFLYPHFERLLVNSLIISLAIFAVIIAAVVIPASIYFYNKHKKGNS